MQHQNSLRRMWMQNAEFVPEPTDSHFSVASYWNFNFQFQKSGPFWIGLGKYIFKAIKNKYHILILIFRHGRHLLITFSIYVVSLTYDSLKISKVGRFWKLLIKKKKMLKFIINCSKIASIFLYILKIKMSFVFEKDHFKIIMFWF